MTLGVQHGNPVLNTLSKICIECLRTQQFYSALVFLHIIPVGIQPLYGAEVILGLNVRRATKFRVTKHVIEFIRVYNLKNRLIRNDVDISLVHIAGICRYLPYTITDQRLNVRNSYLCFVVV